MLPEGQEKMLPKQIVLILWLCAFGLQLTGNNGESIQKLPPQTPSGVAAVATTTRQDYNNATLYEAASEASAHKILSRGKRFVAFPVGSSFSCAICATTGVIGNPNVNYLSMGLNWGVAYDLPNITWVLQNLHGFGPGRNKVIAEAQIKRRHRRDLYSRLETLMSSCVAYERSASGRYFDSGEQDENKGDGRTKTETRTITTTASTTIQHKWRRVLSRPKRYLSFPEGSSFSVAVCFTVGIVGNPRYNYMSYGLNFGVAYDLPNTSWVLNHLHGFAQHPVPPAVLRRRTRRAFYADLETLVDSMGYNGRDCIMRTLCESRQYFQRTKMGMIGEMLRVLFSLPKQRIFSRELDEHADIVHYDRAYRTAHDMDCERQYDCHFSLLELALGKYATPQTDYYSKATTSDAAGNESNAGSGAGAGAAADADADAHGSATN